jgi:hypothetical protein
MFGNRSSIFQVPFDPVILRTTGHGERQPVLKKHHGDAAAAMAAFDSTVSNPNAPPRHAPVKQAPPLLATADCSSSRSPADSTCRVFSPCSKLLRWRNVRCTRHVRKSSESVPPRSVRFKSTPTTNVAVPLSAHTCGAVDALYVHTFALCHDDSVSHESSVAAAFNACSTKYSGLCCRTYSAVEEGGGAPLRSRRQGRRRGRAGRLGWGTAGAGMWCLVPPLQQGGHCQGLQRRGPYGRLWCLP